MDQRLRTAINEAAANAGIGNIDESFYQRIEKYMRLPGVSDLSAERKRAVEAYLGSASIKIAKTEGKDRLEGEDAKAAIWYFHTPVDEDDPCVRGAQKILEIETRRQIEISPLRRGQFARASKDYLVEGQFQNYLRETGSSGLSFR